MDCNTIFVCIEKVDYDALFKNSYVKDTLFFCKENTTKTTTDEYSGKYFMGEFATLEFFKPTTKAKFGENLNDIGIEFKTRKSNELERIVLDNSKNSFAKEQIYSAEDGTDSLWYTSIRSKQTKSNLEVSVLEYSPVYLEQLGFSKAQLNQEMSPEQYNKVVYQGNAYPRKFKSLQSVSIEINPKYSKYLKHIAQNFNFKMSENSMDCGDFTMYFHWNKMTQKTVLKNIVINLTDSVPEQEIRVSPNCTIFISDQTADIKFVTIQRTLFSTH
jgi:hypothetical protein